MPASIDPDIENRFEPNRMEMRKNPLISLVSIRFDSRERPVAPLILGRLRTND